METRQELEKKLAHLESLNDQLISELQYIDTLMRMVGFVDGITGLKQTALDFHEHGAEDEWFEA